MQLLKRKLLQKFYNGQTNFYSKKSVFQDLTIVPIHQKKHSHKDRKAQRTTKKSFKHKTFVQLRDFVPWWQNRVLLGLNSYGMTEPLIVT